jgi:hypothetical protein
LCRGTAAPRWNAVLLPRLVIGFDEIALCNGEPQTATGSQAVSPNSLPTAARSRCGARRAALTSFFLRTHRCVAVAIRLLVPPFSGRTHIVRHRAQAGLCRLCGEVCGPRYCARSASRGKATGMPVPGRCGARPNNPPFLPYFVQKTGVSARSKMGSGFEAACRLLRQSCPKLASESGTESLRQDAI